MKTLTILLASACAAFAVCGAATARPNFGVAEDAGKYADDGGATFYDTLTDLGMTENRMWVFWDATRPTEIVEKPFLDRAVPAAEEHGIRLIFSVAPLRAKAVTRSRLAETQFVEFLQLLARTYPSVKDIIVGNEPNQPRFWQPQFVRGKGVSGAAYERVLARSYDALKDVDPDIRVIGVGLSPRGNDRPNARNNISTSPVRFIRDMGIAYRRSRRNRPIMDLFGFHSYPRFDTDPLERGYVWPNAGITNLSRIKQAVWDAFGGTAQPTFPEAGRDDPDALLFALDEVGWQVRIPAGSKRAYTGRENVKGTAEAQQAQIYSQIVDIVACDPAVESLLFFHLIDEHDLDRFQSGLIRADGSRRQSYWAVKGRIAALSTEEGFVCPGRTIQWRPTTSVVGAQVKVTPWGFVARATEEASFEAETLAVEGPDGLTRRQRTGLRRLGAASPFDLVATGRLKPYVSTEAFVRAEPLAPGWYVRIVRLRAQTNRARTSVFVGPPFRVAT